MRKPVTVSACLLLLAVHPAVAELKIRSLSDVDRAAQKLRNEILSSVSDYSVTGLTYYVSSEGNDANDGLSPEQAFKSLDKVNSMPFNAGDAVLFRRGDIWRGQIRPRSGVSYSAWGKGEKPAIYGSPWNGAKEGEWLPTDAPNVYVYSRTTNDDIGTIVFDDGAAGCAYKVIKMRIPTGDTFHMEDGTVFEDYADLSRDLDLYHDSKGSGKIYLCSLKGNPSGRFSSMEFLVKKHCFRLHNCKDVHIDNFRIRYTGSHGIGSTEVHGLRVTNCEIGWIGGSIQIEAEASGTKTTHPTRYGNAVEIWGECSDYTIDHCWVYQIYDAGLTFQWRVRDKVTMMRNIRFSDNLVEDCVYGIEYFLTPSKDGKGRGSAIENVEFCGNILRRSGYGWGSQRPDKHTPAAIKAWGGTDEEKNMSRNFRIHDNIIDRGTPRLLDIKAGKPEYLPSCNGNVYLQEKGLPLGTMLEKNPDVIEL